MSEGVLVLFQLVVLIFSVIVHEVMHGLVAYWLGDTTAKDAGRLTLNPLAHIDPFGSVLLPLGLYMLSGGGFVLGWARPVPYNPMNLSNPRRGGGLIALSGPASNLVLAIIAALLLRTPFAGVVIQPVLLQITIAINLGLMVFNLVPIPPLDGSKVLFSLLPGRFSRFELTAERYGWWLIILFVLFGFELIIPIVNGLYRLLV